MKVDRYVPNDFELYDEVDFDGWFLWDENRKIREVVKEAIYQKPLFTYLFIDENLYCIIWWNDELGYWCGDLSVNGKYLHTYLCESLEEVSNEFIEEFNL